MDDFPYEDIINRPYPVSAKYSRMTLSERAAQFAPFAAIAGHDDAIADAGRAAVEEVETDSADDSEFE